MKDAQGVAVDDQGVGQAGLGQARGGELGVFRHDFDAQKIDFRPGRRGAAQEQPLARADLDFQRRRPPEEGLGAQRARQLLERLQVAGQVDRRIDLSQCAASHSSRP